MLQVEIFQIKTKGKRTERDKLNNEQVEISEKQNWEHKDENLQNIEGVAPTFAPTHK